MSPVPKWVRFLPVGGCCLTTTTSSVRRDHEKRSRPLCCARPLGVAAVCGRRSGSWQQRQQQRQQRHRLQSDAGGRWEQRSCAAGPGQEVPGPGAASGTASASAALQAGTYSVCVVGQPTYHQTVPLSGTGCGGLGYTFPIQVSTFGSWTINIDFGQMLN